MEVNVHEAKTHLSRLIAAAERGEEVVIARAGKAAVRLVMVAPVAKRPRKELLGAWEGLVTVPTVEEWAAMDRELEAEMNDGELFPPDAL